MMRFADGPNPAMAVRVSRRAIMAGAGASAIVGAIRPSRAAIVNNCVIGKDGWLFPAWDEVRHTDLGRVHRVTQTINTAIEALKAVKIEVLICLVPSKSRVYREFLPDDIKWAPESEKRYATALEDLSRAGTIVPDQAALFSTLRKQQPQTLYFLKADTHWTGEAAEQAAKLIATEAKTKLPLPASAMPGTKLAAPVSVTQERNDLAALLPQQDQAKYPFQSYMLRKPVADGGGGLLSEDAADVLVMGNSFMQPVFGFSSVVSEQLNRPVSLAWKVHQFSPYWNMLNLVRSDGFKKQKPRLLIWDFEESDMQTPADDPGAWGQTAMSPTAFLAGMHGALTA